MMKVFYKNINRISYDNGTGSRSLPVSLNKQYSKCSLALVIVNTYSQ